jgi:hypothetical protein
VGKVSRDVRFLFHRGGSGLLHHLGHLLRFFNDTPLAIGLAALSVFYWRGDFLGAKWSLLLFLCAGYLAWEVGKKLHWSIGLCVASTLFQALWVGAWKYNHLQELHWLETLAHERVALHTALTVVLVAFVFLKLTWDHIHTLVALFIVGSIVDSYLVIVQKLFHVEPMGFIGNPGMNASLIAVIFPLLLGTLWEESGTAYRKRYGLLCILPPVLAVILSGASQPLVLLALGTLLYFIRIAPRIIPYVVGGMSVSFIAGPLLFWSEDFLADTGRYSIWKLMLRDFWEKRSLWFGVGPGESILYIPSAQMEHQYAAGGHAWLWFHSDWLQLLYEQGVVGLLTYLVALYFILKFAWRRPGMFSGAVMTALMGVANFPFRSALHTVWITILVFVICRNPAPRDQG